MRNLDFSVEVAGLDQVAGIRKPLHVVVQLSLQEEVEEPQRVSPKKISL